MCLEVKAGIVRAGVALSGLQASFLNLLSYCFTSYSLMLEIVLGTACVIIGILGFSSQNELFEFTLSKMLDLCFCASIAESHFGVIKK